MGFVLVGKKILLPFYGNDVYNKFAFEFLSKTLPDYGIIPLPVEFCNKLANLNTTPHSVVSQFAHIDDNSRFGEKVNLKEL